MQRVLRDSEEHEWVLSSVVLLPVFYEVPALGNMLNHNEVTMEILPRITGGVHCLRRRRLACGGGLSLGGGLQATPLHDVRSSSGWQQHHEHEWHTQGSLASCVCEAVYIRQMRES